MKIFKPKFWSEKNSFSAKLLYPISIFYKLLLFIKQKTTKELNLNIPIICVGNIYIGGTGKTPISIFIAKEIQKAGKNPAIIRKYYQSHSDEHLLIKKYFSSFILDKSRINGIKLSIKKGHDYAVLDDGFQDYKIKKTISILCFNQRQLIGNGLLFPAGPLRESLNSLKRANIVIINGKKDENFEKLIFQKNKNINIYYSSYRPTNIDQFKNEKLMAVAGIGNPNNFFELLHENNLHICEKLIFPDHHKFSKPEISKIIEVSAKKNLKIIMTEKDFFKIKHLNLPNFNYLKVELEIGNKDKLIKNILNINDKNF